MECLLNNLQMSYMTFDPFGVDEKVLSLRQRTIRHCPILLRTKRFMRSILFSQWRTHLQKCMRWQITVGSHNFSVCLQLCCQVTEYQVGTHLSSFGGMPAMQSNIIVHTNDTDKIAQKFLGRFRQIGRETIRCYTDYVKGIVKRRWVPLPGDEEMSNLIHLCCQTEKQSCNAHESYSAWVD